jgi:hypothetical protein
MAARSTAHARQPRWACAHACVRAAASAGPRLRAAGPGPKLARRELAAARAARPALAGGKGTATAKERRQIYP